MTKIDTRVSLVVLLLQYQTLQFTHSYNSNYEKSICTCARTAMQANLGIGMDMNRRMQQMEQEMDEQMKQMEQQMELHFGQPLRSAAPGRGKGAPSRTSTSTSSFCAPPPRRAARARALRTLRLARCALTSTSTHYTVCTAREASPI